MKKVVVLMFAVVCAAMFIAPAYAEDRVSLYGALRVRSWNGTKFSGVDQNWVDQRFRIGTKIKVADGVSLELRTDYGEGIWGQDYTGGLVSRPRGSAINTIDIDRGFLDINKRMWSLRLGQQYLGLGMKEVLDANATAAKLVLKFPLKTSLIYAKISENGDLNDDGAFEDTDFYAINLSYDTDAFSSNLFAATVNDQTPTDDSPMMFGLHGRAKIGMLALQAELAFAGGDNGSGTDYMGTQFYLQGDVKLTETFSMGAELLYALGTDDPTEQQYSRFSHFGGFTLMADNTPFNGDWTYSKSNKPFDPTGDSAGVQGITLYGKVNVMKGLSLGGKIAYFTPEEDSVTTTDDITSFNVWASYMLATNTQLALAYLYSDHDDPNTVEAEKWLVAKLQVNF